MHFGWTAEQELLRGTAREFLERECPISRVREWMEDPRGYSPEVWAQLAELGWLGLLIPEAYGGSGLGFVDLVAILEETGRALLPSPFLATLQGTLAVLRAGNATQREEILGAVAAGERILSFAITEESGTEDARDLETRAARDGSGYRVTGIKLFVPDGQNADQIVVVARTGADVARTGADVARTGADAESGMSLLLVDRGAPGLEVRPLESIDPTRRIAELRLDGVRAELLGEDAAGWNTWCWVRDRGLVALALGYIEPKHRLNLLDIALRRRVLRARHSFKTYLPGEKADEIEFYDPADVIHGASVRDNLLFGRIGFGMDGLITPEEPDACSLGPANGSGSGEPCGSAADTLALPIRGWAGLTIGYALDL